MQFDWSKNRMQAVLFTILFASLFYFFLPEYLPHHPTDILGVLLLPFVAHSTQSSKKWFYAITAIGFWIVNRSGLNTLYYTSTVCAIFFWWEMMGFRFNFLPLFLLASIAPITRRIFYTWSFPIRLEMSEIAAKALTFIGLPVEAIGNVIYYNETTFSVDPACTGLKMLTIALVFSIFILAWYERRLEKRIPFHGIALFLLLTLLLAVFANFSRLLAMIIFHILPENPMHEVIGLFALAVYVLMPLYFIGKYYVGYFGGNGSGKEETTISFPNNKKILAAIGIGTLIVIGGIENQRPEQNEDENLKVLEIPNFEKEVLPNGVVKMQKENVLLYLKPPVSSFGMTHDPRYCWQGDGWSFKHIQEKKLNDLTVYTAQLEKDQQTLHTFWWYDNGSHQTIKENEWRWKAMKEAKGYYLVNITSDDAEKLRQTAEQLLMSGLLRRLSK